MSIDPLRKLRITVNNFAFSKIAFQGSRARGQASQGKFI